ncbi:MAG: hypothetical protein ACRDTT_35870, partial [Pseudonocardiaceae bacterium]
MSRSPFSRVAPWLIPVLVVVEIVLVVVGQLGLGTAVGLAVLVELLLVVTVVGRTAAGIRRFRAGRTAGLNPWAAAEDGLAELVPRRLAQIILLEPRFWARLARWLTGRHEGRAPTAFSYHRGLRTLTWTMFTLVFVEGAAVEVFLAIVVPHTAWPWVALVAHLYGLAWLVGFHASLATRPHLITAHELRLRDGILTEVVVPYAALKDARLVTRPSFGRSGFKIDESGRVATMAYGDINVTLTLQPGQRPDVDG